MAEVQVDSTALPTQSTPTATLDWAEMDSDDDDLPAFSVDIATTPVRCTPLPTPTLSNHNDAIEEMNAEAERTRDKKRAAMAGVEVDVNTPTPSFGTIPPKSRVFAVSEEVATPESSYEAHSLFPSAPVASGGGVHYTQSVSPSTRSEYRHGMPSSVTRFQAQRRIAELLMERGEPVGIQELSKLLEWKRRLFSRALGSLYAFTKRECKHFVTCEFGKVSLKPEYVMSMSWEACRMQGLTVYDNEEDDEKTHDEEVEDEEDDLEGCSNEEEEGSHSSSSAPKELQGEGGRGVNGVAEKQVTPIVSPSSQTLKLNETPIKKHDIDDIAQSLLSMQW